MGKQTEGKRREGEQSEPPSPLKTAGVTLEGLAERSPGESGRTVLRHIAREAQEGGLALAGVDLITAYPPEVLVPDGQFQRGRWAARLATLRDVFVFVPIVVTWISLWLAFDDFEEEPADTNFLHVWSHGFGGTAIGLVVGLVSAVVLFTLLLHAMDEAASNDALRQQVAEQLLVINAEVSIAVAGDAAQLSSGKLVQIGQEITVATGDLAETMRAGTERLARIFEPGPEGGFTQALEKWSSSADELGAMGRSLTVPHGMLRDFTAMRDRLSSEEQATRDALQALVAELGEATETSRVSDLAHSRVAEVVVEGSRQVALAMEKFVASSESLHGYMTVLQRVLDRLDSGWTAEPQAGLAMSNAEPYPMPGPRGEQPNGHGNGGTRGAERSAGAERPGGVDGWYEPEGE